MRPLNHIDWLVVHCSATAPDEDIGVDELRRTNMQRGGLDVAYHYVIRRDGTLEKGRPDNMPGSHAAGYDLHSLGICMVGGRKKRTNKAEANFTPAQYLTLQTLLEELSTQHTEAEALGHRDLPGVTHQCPSFDVREWLRRIYAHEEAALYPQDRNESSV